MTIITVSMVLVAMLVTCNVSSVSASTGLFAMDDFSQSASSQEEDPYHSPDEHQGTVSSPYDIAIRRSHPIGIRSATTPYLEKYVAEPGNSAPDQPNSKFFEGDYEELMRGIRFEDVNVGGKLERKFAKKQGKVPEPKPVVKNRLAKSERATNSGKAVVLASAQIDSDFYTFKLSAPKNKPVVEVQNDEFVVTVREEKKRTTAKSTKNVALKSKHTSPGPIIHQTPLMFNLSESLFNDPSPCLNQVSSDEMTKLLTSICKPEGEQAHEDDIDKQQ